MIEKKKIQEIVCEWLQGKDYFLVDVTVSADDRVVVEIDCADGVWVDDCAQLSRYIEEKLNRDEEDFELEVGSAGLGQPFKVRQQYDIHVGDPVETLTRSGQKLVGLLKEANDNGFVITVERKVKPEGAKRPKMISEDVSLAYDDVKFTKYCIK